MTCGDQYLSAAPGKAIMTLCKAEMDYQFLLTWLCCRGCMTRVATSSYSCGIAAVHLFQVCLLVTQGSRCLKRLGGLSFRQYNTYMGGRFLLSLLSRVRCQRPNDMDRFSDPYLKDLSTECMSKALLSHMSNAPDPPCSICVNIVF